MEIKVMENVLKTNQEVAEENNQRFREADIFTINLLGSPGAGKTTLLERTFEILKEKTKAAVIEGDIYTSKDADRIKKHGIPVVQINTEGGCHLDSKMIAKVMGQFDFNSIDLMIIENVGNLVCPAAYDLGEDAKVVVLSIAEGADKPLKYPRIFLEAKAVVLNKIDLLPFSDVNMEELRKDILSINPDIEIFEVSSREPKGLEGWTNWLLKKVLDDGNFGTKASG